MKSSIPELRVFLSIFVILQVPCFVNDSFWNNVNAITHELQVEGNSDDYINSYFSYINMLRTTYNLVTQGKSLFCFFSFTMCKYIYMYYIYIRMHIYIYIYIYIWLYITDNLQRSEVNTIRHYIFSENMHRVIIYLA